MHNRFLALFLLLLGCLAARADEGPRWIEVKTEHFVVLTDAGAHEARHVAAQLEQMHAFFAKLVPRATADAGSQIIAVAVRNRKDLQTLEPAAYLAKGTVDLAGLFVRQPDRSYILLRLDVEGPHPYATVYHEYTHYMDRHASLPVWLDEGLAQFFQNTDFMDKTAVLGKPNLNELRFLQRQALIPLPTLLAVDHTSAFYHEQDKGNVFYGESWALTHMLWVQDFTQHEERLRQYVANLEKGEDSVTAATHAFGDLKALQSRLEGYTLGRDMMEFTMPLPLAVKEGELQVEPVSEGEANAIRAGVLVSVGRVR